MPRFDWSSWRRIYRRFAVKWAFNGPIFLLISCGLTLIAIIGVGSAFMAATFRDRALQVAIHDIQNNAKLLSRHFDQRLEDFTNLQNEIAERLRKPAANGELTSSATHEWLKGKVSGTSDIAGINVFGEEGQLLNSSDRWPVASINVSDRQYFRFLKVNSQISSSIQFVQGRFSSAPAIVFARAVRELGTQRFLGVVTRGLDPSVLHEFFASVALGGSAAISLFHNDGTLLARYPEEQGAAGQVFNLAVLHAAPEKKLRLVSPVDGAERLIGVHSLAQFPLSVVVSTEVASALADWQSQTRFLIVAASLAATVIAAVLALIIKQLLHQHRAARRHLDAALNNMTQGLVLYDRLEHVVFCNARFIEMSGAPQGSIRRGSSLSEVLERCHRVGTIEGDARAFRSALLECISQGNLHEALSKTPDGRYLTAVSKPLANGGWITTLQDVTDRKLSEERILHLAQHDNLTGLPNRERFREELQKALAARSSIALLYIDIDDFKTVNDSLGHPVGDAFLRSIADRLKDCAQEEDFVARLGGDEFAIIRSGAIDGPGLQSFAGLLLDSLRHPHQCGDLTLPAAASVGIALAPSDGETSDELINNADLAMYAAKAEGRRSFKFFDPTMSFDVKSKRAMETDLKSAIAEGALELHYQPLIDLASGEFRGCEALVRWNHPTRGAVSPSTFIPIAEESRLIIQLGNWVLKTACMEASSWPSHIKIAVNVSPVQLRCPSLALTLASALASSGLLAERLDLEITEAVLIRDDETALAVLHQIKSLGVQISLDDFGTGYSSLSYLRRFPFDKLKIDKSFIRDIAYHGGSAPLVEAIVKMAQDYGMETVAEGVETVEQLSRVREIGCTIMQGFLISPAKDADTIRKMIASSGSWLPADARRRHA